MITLIHIAWPDGALGSVRITYNRAVPNALSFEGDTRGLDALDAADFSRDGLIGEILVRVDRMGGTGTVEHDGMFPPEDDLHP